MSALQIVFQTLNITTTIVGIFQKEKWKIMLLYTINNIISALMYLVFARYATMAICLVAAVRTVIFGLYSFKGKKPNIVFLILFESLFVITTIVMWQDAFDLIVLFAILFAGYGSWQENKFILRISYIINRSLYVAYYFIISAYISFASTIGLLTCEVICFIYYCILKKETPIMQVIFKNRKKENKNINDNKKESENTENKITIETEEQTNQNVT